MNEGTQFPHSRTRIKQSSVDKGTCHIVRPMSNSSSITYDLLAVSLEKEARLMAGPMAFSKCLL